MTRRMPTALGLALALCAVAGGAPAARAQEAAPDMLLHQFLHSLSDSTDSYFGLVAAPLDTAGLDSALAAGLARPCRGPRARTRFGYGPVLGFNRVDGTLAGASLGLTHGARWRVGGDLAHAGGSHQWLGRGAAWAGFR